jgi:hypothetical protein
MAVIDLKNCTIKLKDGSSTPKSLTIKVGDGNLTYTIARNIEYILNRGVLDAVREGNQVPCKLSLNCNYDFYQGDALDPGGAVSPAEAIQGTGGAVTAGWVSAGSDLCEPYAIDVVVENNISCGSVKDETLTFTDFRYESIDFDVKAGTLSVSGSCNVIRPTSVRSTLT